jgi:hypothetical protein
MSNASRWEIYPHDDKVDVYVWSPEFGRALVGTLHLNKDDMLDLMKRLR